MMRRRGNSRCRRSKQDGWEGEINTLIIERKVRLIPNDNNRMFDAAPAFRVMLGWQMVGDAWETREYGRVEIDDPLCSIRAPLFHDPEETIAGWAITVQGQGYDHGGRANRP